MRKITFLLPAAGVAGIFLAACLSAPDEPASPGTPDAGQGDANTTCVGRVFNGACRTECTTSASCGAGESCMTVGKGTSLCLDSASYASCGYFGSDTACAGVASGATSSSYSGEDPYWVPGPDPNPYYTSGYGGVTPYGCAGNGPFLVEPPLAGDDPKCGEPHDVIRCERVGNRCALVTGSTIDVAEH